MNIKRILAFFSIILLLGVLSYFYHPLTTNAVKNDFQDYSRESATLLRVIDGDTIEVTGPTIGNKTHIRMLGINTPEKKMPFSNESVKFLRQFEGNSIELLRDWEDTDKYKRKLRYMFYEDRLINLEILELGLANAYYYSGLKYEKEILRAEEQARKSEVGIWRKSQAQCADCITLKELNSAEEYFTIRNFCSLSCNLSGWVVKDAGRNTIKLSDMSGNEQKTYASKNNTDIWNNAGDKFFIFDDKGLLVLFYEY